VYLPQPPVDMFIECIKNTTVQNNADTFCDGQLSLTYNTVGYAIIEYGISAIYCAI